MALTVTAHDALDASCRAGGKPCHILKIFHHDSEFLFFLKAGIHLHHHIQPPPSVAETHVQALFFYWDRSLTPVWPALPHGGQHSAHKSILNTLGA
jgi:hypothetical protein